MNYSNIGEEVHNGTEDIISDLPRNVIDSILEFMPMQDAARTSNLSRKWRNIWSSHPIPVLDKEFFVKTFETERTYEFEKLINKLLFSHNGPILKFSLYIPEEYFVQTLLIDQWMPFLSKNGIKELFLDNHAAATADNALKAALHYQETADSMDESLSKLRILIVERNKEADADEEFRISKHLMCFSRASSKAELIYLDPSELVN
ncbi:F-box/FBD/LRR-repeat protein At1g13570-like [Cornus florida]|uniref:F-box/FBD/LRR-repeat protein At1g13570-like n=1 Tax=Cornus florida TaxID=4283 RepID=UPI00289A1C10|nr:F-box/FBD/LRR-repeat protein At1g13570-like [Cornus florida]